MQVLKLPSNLVTLSCFNGALLNGLFPDMMTFVQTLLGYIVHRVSSDLENLEMSGNFDASRKCQGKAREFSKNEKSKVILLYEISFSEQI